MRRALLVAGAVLALAALPVAAAPGKPQQKTAVPPSLKNPMVFYLAHGEPNACGLGCDEWIAAEGEITAGTADRMRAFLKRLSVKDAKRPIYFYSPGGITAESMAMGRLMRQRGMTARVARTLPFDCTNERERECAALKRSGRALVARLSTSQGGCFSACVYAIVGARVREIAPDARLGVHAAKTVIIGLPKNVIVSPETRARFKAENQQALRRYLIEMSIPGALLDAAEKVPHESIYVLSRDEMVVFRIDTRNAVESNWTYEERSSDGYVVKSVQETGASPFRRSMLRLSCYSGKFVFDFLREIGPQENALVPMRLVAASQVFELPPSARSGMSEGDKRYDMRGVVIPANVLEIAAAEDSIEIEPQPEGSKQAAVRFSTLGLAGALSSLTKHCGQVAAGGSELAPRQSP